MISLRINFGIVVDGTQDIQGKEQQCICVRYVTDTFQIKEEFLGLYNTESTSGLSISAMIFGRINQAAITNGELKIPDI